LEKQRQTLQIAAYGATWINLITANQCNMCHYGAEEVLGYYNLHSIRQKIVAYCKAET